MFIYCFDSLESKKLEERGFILINKTEDYYMFKAPKTFNFDLSSFKNIKISNKMNF